MNPVVEKRNLMTEIEAAFVKCGLGNDALRQHAFGLFLKKGFPGLKSEEYKFTPITRILEKVIPTDLQPAPDTSPTSLDLVPDLACNVIVFVNGRFSKKDSIILDSSIELKLSQAGTAEPQQDTFDLLNQALTDSLVIVTVAPGIQIQHPLAFVHYFDSPNFVLASPRWACMVGRQSGLSILEYTICRGETIYFNNKHSHVEVGEGAAVDFVTIQNGPKTDLMVNNSNLRLASRSRASCFTFTFDGQLIRNNLTLSLDGEGIETHLYGLYLLSKNTIADNHTVVDHRKPNSNSNELYKGVMDGNSKGIFNGKIFVRPDAQKTNAFQSNRNILLSETASINTKPQLEIWADDVKCSHGCTTGQMDEEALFYLRTRGISKEMARGMMLHAFAAETFVPLKHEALKTFIEARVSNMLHNTLEL